MLLRIWPARRSPSRSNTLADLPPNPRAAATQWLAEKIRDGEAGLDPYDRMILVVKAEEYERVWAYRAFELCGYALDVVDEGSGARRIRGVVDDDVRLRLKLYRPDAPLMVEEPLSSRGVDAGIAWALARIESVSEPASRQAIRDAHAAYLIRDILDEGA
jgi:hypothetical protein